MRKLISLMVFSGLLVALALPAGANLMENGEMVYDDVRDLTWYDHPFDPGFDDWPATEAWISQLSVGPVADWRAPTLTEILDLGLQLRATGQYDHRPFAGVGNPATDFQAFYLTSTVAGDQRWAYSLSQDRRFVTAPLTSVWGVAVIDGRGFEPPLQDGGPPVAEPATLLLTGLGALAGGVVALRRRGA